MTLGSASSRSISRAIAKGKRGIRTPVRRRLSTHEREPERKFSILIESFTPHHANTLVGFCSIIIAEMRLRIRGLTVHQKNNSRWCGLPGKPQIGRDGVVLRDEHGRTLYLPALEFTDSATRAAFSGRVIAALLEAVPDAFNEPPPVDDLLNRVAAPRPP